jgi:transposase
MASKTGKRDYSIEFKIDAARWVVDQGYTVKDACERLGVPLSNMTRWLSQYEKANSSLDTNKRSQQPMKRKSNDYSPRWNG